ncbi:hypothetical protein BDV18DRAFT_148844 [Aspergillus unguis]
MIGLVRAGLVTTLQFHVIIGLTSDCNVANDSMPSWLILTKVRFGHCRKDSTFGDRAAARATVPFFCLFCLRSGL